LWFSENLHSVNFSIPKKLPENWKKNYSKTGLFQDDAPINNIYASLRDTKELPKNKRTT
jgi:hypothetical protein